jgi:hypothetical protein
VISPDEFGALFDRFRSSAFRMETRQAYVVEEDQAAIEGWRAGRARPEYSVRTSPWAARLAATSIAGKSWRRVRVVELPLSEYVRWEMAAYIESAVLGEEIRVLVRTTEFDDLAEDFWLFDAAEPQALAVAMRYDEEGTPGEHQLVTDPDLIIEYTRAAERAWRAGTPLNQFLAAGNGLRLTA